MLSEIIKNIALILDDQSAINYLANLSEDDEENTNVELYITLVNFVLTDIAQSFLCYKCTQDLVSDENGTLLLSDFWHTPCSIKAVKDDTGKKIRFYATDDYLVVGEMNKLYYVEYCYLPEELTSLDDSVLLPLGLDARTICYGAVSEYYAIKMLYTEANIWEQKYKAGLKNMLKKYKGLKFASRSLF